MTGYLYTFAHSTVVSKCYLKYISDCKVSVFLPNGKANHIDAIEMTYNSSQCTVIKIPLCNRFFAKSFQ